MNAEQADENKLAGKGETVPSSADRATPGWFERFKRWIGSFPWLVLAPRLVLAAVGIGALAVGLKAAWTVNAATPALVVAAVLIALAFVWTPDLTEFSARYKDLEFRYLRDKAETLAEVSEVLTVALQTEGEDENLRRTVEQLAAESGRAAAREEREAERRLEQKRAQLIDQLMGRRREERQRNSFLEALGRSAPRATHTLEEGSKAVTLTLLNPPPGAVSTTVKRPDGHTDTRVALGIAADAISLAYPQEFGPEAQPLVPGRYVVEWRDLTLQGGVSRIIGARTGPVVATGEFEIREATDEAQG